jgi:PRTRC genetic system protein E
MFSELLPLLKTATVTLIVSQVAESPPCLRVTVIPKPKDEKVDKTLFRAFNVEATVDELEHPENGFAKLLQAERVSRQGVEVAITDLKAANEAAAEAKKEEAKRKRSEAKPANKVEEKKEDKEEAPPMPSLFGGEDENPNS